MLVLALLVPSLVGSMDSSIDMSWLYPAPAPPAPPTGGGFDMSATFARFHSCKSCITAGYGWCPVRRKCGGFANTNCGEGDQYFVPGSEPKQQPEKQQKKRKSQAQRSSSHSQPPPPQQGSDMSSFFATLRSCDACVAAGYGWCPMQRKCGGFANHQCGVGERYHAAGAAVRNGIWKSKAEREEQEEPAASFVVPDAAPPPPATVLHAADIRPFSPAAGKMSSDVGENHRSDSDSKRPDESATTEVPSSAFVTVSPAGAQRANKTHKSVEDLRVSSGQLKDLSRTALESMVLELQAELKMWREL